MKPMGPIPPGFIANPAGHLMIGGRSANELVTEAGGTPLIVYDSGMVERQIDRFRGRDDAMIKVSGNRLSPTEIEEAALASGAVREVLALGVKDERLGQAVKLIAVAKGEDAEQRLRVHLAAELPAYMQPREIVWRDELPVSPNGKVDRAALVKAFA